MIEIRSHVLMDTLVVSLWCEDRAIGHDHCIWSGRTQLWDTRPEHQLEGVERAVTYVNRLLDRGELDELTGDCWGS